MNPLIQSKNEIILPVLIALTLGCFGLSPQARAVCHQGCDLVHDNTVLGDDALGRNITGILNTAIGWAALASNTTGFDNTAIGWAALASNTLGPYNTAIGGLALGDNTTGEFNTATGFQALINNTTGSSNIGLGHLAGQNLTTGSNNIVIGNDGVAGESNHIRIGSIDTHTDTFIAGISGVTVPNGVAVQVSRRGHLGTIVSSERVGDAIKPIDKVSEAILALKPVTFRYKKALDPEGIPQFGLVAEDVEKVNPDLVARDEEGKAYTVRYEAVNAMLLNEFLKEHRRNEAQQKQIEALTAMVKAQAAQIQKMSDQLGIQAAAPRLVAND